MKLTYTNLQWFWDLDLHAINENEKLVNENVVDEIKLQENIGIRKVLCNLLTVLIKCHYSKTYFKI